MIRTVVETSTQNLVIIDVFSRLAQDRILWINGEITDDLANNIVNQLIILDNHEVKEITILINSPGGSAYAGFSIIDRMNKVRSPIKTYVQGIAMSMAAIILSCGDERVMAEHSTVMFHQGRAGVIDKISDMNITVNEYNRINDSMFGIIEKNTKIKREDIKDDFYMDAEKALSLNVIDKIDLPTKK